MKNNKFCTFFLKWYDSFIFKLKIVYLLILACYTTNWKKIQRYVSPTTSEHYLSTIMSALKPYD